MRGCSRVRKIKFDGLISGDESMVIEDDGLIKGDGLIRCGG